MSGRQRVAIGLTVIVSALGGVLAGAQAAFGEDAGKVKYRLDAAPYFTAYDHEDAWMASHLSLVKAYPPFGDVFLSSGVPVLGYHDAATEGFAPLTPASVESYVAKVKRDAGAGYAGTFLDDVNWTPSYRDWSQSRSAEPEVAELAKLVEATRAAIPGGLIEMNSQYHDIYPLYKEGNPYVLRALASINLLCKEFGVGPTSGINTASDFANFLSFADELRSKGVHLTMTSDPSSPTAQTMEYNEATYLLINDGHDYINGQQQTPQSWWPGFDVDLGEAAGSRYSWNGVLRRDFAGGVSLVNPPGSPTVTVSLPGPMRTAAGSQVSSVTLGPAAGAVLAGSAPAPAAPSAAPSPTPASVSGPVATETVLQTTEVPSPQSHPASPAFASSSGSGHRPHLQRHSHSHRRHRRGATGHARTASRRPATRSRGLTRVSGSVIHATGGTVTIRIEVRVHGRWRLARSLPLDVGQSGAFGRILRLVHGGLYRARALYAGTAAYAPSSSGYRLLVLHTR